MAAQKRCNRIFADNLFTFLEEKGWTISRLIQELDKYGIEVTEKTVRNWRDAVNYPQTETLISLSEILGVSVDELVKSDINDAKQKRGLGKFSALNENEKEVLYKLCENAGSVYFAVKASNEAIYLQTEMLSYKEFIEYYKKETTNRLIVGRMEDFFNKLLKKDSRLNQLWRNLRSGENPEYIVKELAEEAGKYVDIAFKEDDGKTARNETGEPYSQLYDSDKETYYKKDFDFYRNLMSIFEKSDLDDGAKDSLPVDYNFIDTDTNSYNTYYYWEISMGRTDFVNFFSNVHSRGGIALVASVAAQEEKLKQQYFQSLADKEIIGGVSADNYMGIRTEEGNFVFADEFSVELRLTNEEKLYFMTEYCREKHQKLLSL